MKTTNNISSCLWLDGQAEEAANFYISVFENAEINATTYYDKAAAEASGNPEGSVLTVGFEVEGFSFLALNGGPHFKINPSISFFVNCETETEVDRLWEKLSEGGEALMPLDKYDFSEKYGWIEDKYGVSWQLIMSSPEGDGRPKIIPSLLFTGEKSGKTKEAINFYTSVFRDSKAGMIAPNEKPGAEGTTAFADFMLEGQWIAAMDSPDVEHKFIFNEAVSLVVNCESQDEIDYYWKKLSAVPEAEACGWLKDKYGVSWQIVPENINELIKHKKAMKAMLQMKKLDIEALKQAANE